MVIFTRHSAPPSLALPRSIVFDLDNFDPEGTDPGDSDAGELLDLCSLKPRYLATSCSGIDHALTGGFLYGQINSLAANSADALNERTLVAMHAVTTHLLSQPEAQAVWIDTEGKFSPSQLKDVISFRLLSSGIHMTVGKVLDRVQIIRVFDIYGIVEVVNELKQTCEDKEAERALESLSINDSRREDKDPLKISKGGRRKMEDYDGIGVVVIDTINQPLLELTNAELEEFQKQDEWTEDDEKPEAVGLFVAACRSFSLLAKERDVCVLFLNTTSFAPDDGDPFCRWHEVSPSAFVTTEERPALGPVYAECVDLSIMISKYPHNLIVTDLLGQEGAGDFKELCCKEQTATEMAAIIQKMELAGFKLDNIIEVVGDRNGPRSGMFGAFVIDGVKLLDAMGLDILAEKFSQSSAYAMST